MRGRTPPEESGLKDPGFEVGNGWSFLVAAIQGCFSDGKGRMSEKNPRAVLDELVRATCDLAEAGAHPVNLKKHDRAAESVLDAIATVAGLVAYRGTGEQRAAWRIVLMALATPAPQPNGARVGGGDG